MAKDHDNAQQNPPPHNLAAEMAVLGAVLFDNNALQRVADFLKARDFYAPANGAIFQVLDTLVAAGEVADGVTLREHFDRDGQLQEIGGARYLADLLDSAAFGPEIVDYARLIHDLALRRELIGIGSEIVQKATSPEIDEPGERQIEAAEKSLFALAERGAGNQGFQTFSSALAQSIRTATLAYKRDGKIAGVATGLDDLDRLLGGLHKSDLVILAARPSMGKTALAVNIAYHAAKNCKRSIGPNGSMKTDDGAVVGFFSLEMSSDQLANRVLADIANVASDKIRGGNLTPSDYESIREAAIQMEGLPLYIDDMGGISISQLSARARRLTISSTHAIGSGASIRSAFLQTSATNMWSASAKPCSSMARTAPRRTSSIRSCATGSCCPATPASACSTGGRARSIETRSRVPKSSGRACINACAREWKTSWRNVPAAGRRRTGCRRRRGRRAICRRPGMLRLPAGCVRR